MLDRNALDRHITGNYGEDQFARGGRFLDPDDCEHENVEADDDGAGGHWFACTACHAVMAAERNEDGGTDWVVAE